MTGPTRASACKRHPFELLLDVEERRWRLCQARIRLEVDESQELQVERFLKRPPATGRLASLLCSPGWFQYVTSRLRHAVFA